MKTASDPRHLKRQHLVTRLFAYSFQLPKKPPQSIKDIILQLPRIDVLITQAAPQFPIAKINKMDLAILRLAVFEFRFQKNQPEKVIIDEAIELGKEFGAESSPKFINGVLGTILKKKKPMEKS